MDNYLKNIPLYITDKPLYRTIKLFSININTTWYESNRLNLTAIDSYNLIPEFRKMDHKLRGRY